MEHARRIGGAFLRADNPQALSHWYAQRLGVEATREEPHGVVLFAGQPGSTTSGLSLEVDDLDAMVAQLRASGVHVDVDEQWHPDGRFARLHDPAGNPVQLCQPTGSNYVRTLEDDDLPSERPARRMPARWLALAMGVLIAVVLAVVVTQRSDNPEAAPEDPAATTTTTAEPTTTTTSPTKPVTTVAGRLAVHGNWEIFAYGAGELVRIDVARGRITRTPIPNAELTSEGPTSLVVGPDSALVSSWERGNVELVVDGKPASPQPDWPQAGGARLLPGPKPGQLWQEEHRPTDVVLKPMTMRGKPAPGRSITVPQNFYVQSSDQRGNVVATGIGGAYLVDPDGMHRITTGALIAVGPSRFLTQACDERARCRLEAVDRSTGAVRPLGRDLESGEMIHAGLITANGQTAAMKSSGPNGEQLHLLDLRTGAARLLDVQVGAHYGDAAMAWSPDGRWLLVVSGGDGLVVVDAATARVRPLGVELSAVEAVAVRE